MADYAPNFTPRYVFNYTSAGAPHSMQVRVARGTVRADAAVTSKLAVVLSSMSTALLIGFAVTSGTYYPEDGDIGFPVVLGDLIEVEGSSAVVPNATYRAVQLRFEGRGDQGGRTSLSVFGTVFVDLDGDPILRDFRILSSENVPIASVITALSELAPQFVAMGSTTTVWKSYANVKFNDAWVRKIRAGA
jgi:hypothetical protein